MGLLDIEDAETVEGQGEALDKVHRFIKNIQESVEMEGGFVFSLIQHGRASDEEDPVFTSELEVTGNARELAQEIIDAAIEDVSEFFKGTHKYVVRADNVRARCLFSLKVNPKEEDEDMDDIEELPNKKGLLSQLMRHQEKIMKVAVGSVKSVIDMQARSIKERDSRISELEGRQIDTIKMTEDLMSGRHARDLEMRKLETKEKRMGEIAGVVMQGAPVLLSMIANSQAKTGADGNAPPAQMGPSPQSSPIESMVEALIGDLTPEQFAKIYESGVFSPMQIVTLVEIAKSVQAKQQAAEAAAASAANAVANG